jgi:hypothetical protein
MPSLINPYPTAVRARAQTEQLGFLDLDSDDTHSAEEA